MQPRMELSVLNTTLHGMLLCQALTDNGLKASSVIMQWLKGREP